MPFLLLPLRVIPKQFLYLTHALQLALGQGGLLGKKNQRRKFFYQLFSQLNKIIRESLWKTGCDDME